MGDGKGGLSLRVSSYVGADGAIGRLTLAKSPFKTDPILRIGTDNGSYPQWNVKNRRVSLSHKSQIRSFHADPTRQVHAGTHFGNSKYRA